MTKRFRMLSGAALGALMLTMAGVPDARAFDTTALPRVNVAKELFANPATTGYLSREPVAATAEAVERALGEQGWQRYALAFAQVAESPTLRTLTFKKEAQLLSVFVTVAPAQGNATSVQYSAMPLVHDLPFPAGATDITFDTSRPHLACLATGSIADMLDVFRTELGARGWSPWIGNTPGTDREASFFFTRDGQRPLLLILQRADDGRTRVKLEGVPQRLLDSVAKNREPAPVAAATPKPAPAAPAAKTEIDRMIENTMRDALQMAREAGRPARPAAQPTAPQETLRAMAGGSAPIPVPDTAKGVEHDGEDGSLEFTSPSSVASIGAFYRAGMKPLGFSERPSVINRPNMAVLTFVKQGKTVTLTVMQMGSETSVRAGGSALITAAAAPKRETAGAPAQANAAPAPANAAPRELEAGETFGLPVPADSSQKGTERTPFRVVLNARVRADLPSVLAFYRRELGKRDWKEDGATDRAAETAVNYVSPEGPAVLVLTRKDDETVVKLSLRKPAVAEKAGLLPKADQAKLVIGNVLDAETIITIDKRTIKVGPQVGARKPDGPMLDLKPGKYTFSFKSAGQPPRTDEVTVAAGETWGILIGPGGALPLQAY